jgi:hypothetical protein
MMTDATVSPRFQRIAAWVREHGVTCYAGANMETGHEFVRIEIPYAMTDETGDTVRGIEVVTCHSKADAARALGY